MKGCWSDVFLDMRFAARTFARRPVFCAVAAFTLALGIGATTAVFSIVHAVLLSPLPYKEPDRLAAVWITSAHEGSLAKIFATYRDYIEFRQNARTLEGVSAATWATRTGRVLTGFGPSRAVLTIPASGSFFETLGVRAAIGRTFRAEDEGRGCFVVVAHRFWMAALGADSSVVGKSLTLDQKPCTVLGVMPEHFSFYPSQTQLWVLLGPNYQPEQDGMLVGIFARLKPGATLAQAETELRSIHRATQLSSEARDLEPIVRDLHGEFTFLAGRTLRTTLVLVFAAVLLVLLIACLNVANLLLAGLSERRRELAVRAALGSGQGRLIRQVLTEGLFLSGLGAALGVGLAYAAVRYFRHANPIELTVGGDVSVNLPVLAFGIFLSIATTLIFGLLPAIRASQVDLAQYLKAGGRGLALRRQSAAKAVIAVEMALSFVLLIGAGLLMTSALRMGSEPLGFKPDRVLATGVGPPASGYPTDAGRTRFYDQLLERLSLVPGAADVALASKLPPNAGGNQALEVQGRPVESGSAIHDTGADAVSPRFFEVLGIPLRVGRAFNDQDRATSPPVAIVNEALVRKYFPNTNPLGQQLRIKGGSMPWLTIVGVVGNLKHTQLMNEMSWIETPIFYRPLAQEPRQSVQIAVRGRGDLGLLRQEIQRQIAAVDPLIPIPDVEALPDRLAKTLAYPRFRATVLTLFAFGALILSGVGLYGVLSQLVVQRTPEFGVRRALGAATYDLLVLVARQGGVPVLAGLGVGICLTFGFGRLLAGLLYGIEATDPGALGLVSLTLLTVAALAIWLPAARAARVEPMVALREE